MPQDEPTAKKFVWSKSSPRSPGKLERPLGGGGVKEVIQ